MAQAGAPDATRVALLAPSPILTVTVEHDATGPEIHIHGGGQGFWVARMLRSLGAAVSFCAPLGGEVGTLLRPVLEAAGLELCAVESGGSNGAYVHERHSGGEPITIAETASPVLTRHETDALYAATLSSALDASLTVLTGPRSEEVIEPDFYRRLAGDLRRNGHTVVADLSGLPLTAALAGGLDILHLSARELFEHAGEPPGDLSALIGALRRLREQGARTVLVSRGPEPTIVLLEDRLLELSGPVFETREERGAGDSMVAAIAASVARGRPLDEALRMGAAAGALNVVRRGLGSGSRADIEHLAADVTLRPVARISS